MNQITENRKIINSNETDILGNVPLSDEDYGKMPAE